VSAADLSADLPMDPAVTEDRDFGRAAVSLGWVPAPRYLLRRAAVLALLRSATPGRVLEIGCGAGSLLADLRALSHDCTAVETSEEARRLAARMLADAPAIEVHDAVRSEWNSRFDLLLAFEVLEHIEDDTAALREWLTYLKPGGRLMISMPAHARRWTATDTWAGHVRRYDRADMLALAERVGVRVIRCENYGFPLSNLIEPVNAWAHGRQLARRSEAAPDRDALSGESGVKRSLETRLYPAMTSLPGRLAMRAAIGMQRWFRHTELGNGFILEAVKP